MSKNLIIPAKYFELNFKIRETDKTSGNVRDFEVIELE